MHFNYMSTNTHTQKKQDLTNHCTNNYILKHLRPDYNSERELREGKQLTVFPWLVVCDLLHQCPVTLQIDVWHHVITRELLHRNIT